MKHRHTISLQPLISSSRKSASLPSPGEMLIGDSSVAQKKKNLRIWDFGFIATLFTSPIRRIWSLYNPEIIIPWAQHGFLHSQSDVTLWRNESYSEGKKATAQIKLNAVSKLYYTYHNKSYWKKSVSTNGVEWWKKRNEKLKLTCHNFHNTTWKRQDQNLR